MTPSYFSSIFKKETGQTFSDYVTNYRIQVAKKMLKEEDKNISEIADALGYVDVRYFSKIFKRYVHISPSEFRRLEQAKTS